MFQNNALDEHKKRYATWCSEHYLPLQHQPWWLDAVCGADAWQIALAEAGGGEIVGAMPCFFRRRWGLPVVQLPPLTTYAGPWLYYPPALENKSLSRRLGFEKRVMTELIRQLPRTVFFRQNFRPELSNWLPFYWAGFRQTTRYTYLFDKIENVSALIPGFKNALRRNIKNAARHSDMRRDDSAEEIIFQLHQQSMLRKNRRPSFSLDQFQTLHVALQQRKQSACFLAFDRKTGAPSAGIYLAFDAREAGLLLSGTATDFKSHDAVCGLLLEALRFCAEHGLRFDFEGSMDARVERFFRAFGARLAPYAQVWRWG